MARINSALYNNGIIDAFEVDDDYENYDRENFKCPECSVKVQYNRGINQLDPHFKNWPKIEHNQECEILKIQILGTDIRSEHKQILTSTIIPRAERLQNFSSKSDKEILVKRYLGKRSQRFLNSLLLIETTDYENLYIRTEDKKTVLLSDLIKRQDEIIEKLNIDGKAFICVLKGYLTKGIDVADNIKIPLTFGGNYKNKNKFDLFIPSSFKHKNIEKVRIIENSLIYCYGLAEKNQYGYKMDLYSISHQIVKL